MSYINEMFGLAGVRAVVTGGAGVLPSTMAAALVKAGATVSIWGRGTNHPVEEAVKALADETGAPDRVSGETVDTGESGEVEAALGRAEGAIGLPNLLVNGVGGNKGKSDFVDIDTELLMHVMRMNLLGGFIIPTQIFARRWLQEGIKGNVINLASMTSFKALSGVWAYNAAKSAVKNMTEGAAREFGPAGIRVNAIAPGFFLGHQNRRLLIKDDATGELTDRGQAIIDRTPFGRFGDKSEIAGLTVFLASEAASGFLTGTTIPLDGGYLTDNI